MLADDVTAYKKCAEDQVRCYSGHLAESHVVHWQGGLSMVSGAYAQKGYDFEQPSLFPLGSKSQAELPGQGSLEVFDYMGESEINKRPQPYANTQLEALQKTCISALDKVIVAALPLGNVLLSKTMKTVVTKGRALS